MADPLTDADLDRIGRDGTRRPQPPTVAEIAALIEEVRVLRVTVTRAQALVDVWDNFEAAATGTYPEAAAYADGRELQATACADALRDVLTGHTDPLAADHLDKETPRGC